MNSSNKLWHRLFGVTCVFIFDFFFLCALRSVRSLFVVWFSVLGLAYRGLRYPCVHFVGRPRIKYLFVDDHTRLWLKTFENNGKYANISIMIWKWWEKRFSMVDKSMYASSLASERWFFRWNVTLRRAVSVSVCVCVCVYRCLELQLLTPVSIWELLILCKPYRNRFMLNLLR